MPKVNDEGIVLVLDKDIAVDFHDWEPDDYALHYHDHFELEIVTKGQGSQIFNGETFSLEKNDIFLTRPLDYHKIHSDGISFASVNIKPGILPKWLLTKLHSFKNPKQFHLNDEEYEKFIFLISMLDKEKEEKDIFRINIDIVELLLKMFLKLNKEDQFEDDAFVSKVVYYLQQNNRFTQKVSLEDIANYVGYSKYYTSSMFHKKYGMTIQDFILNLKIEYSKKLMIETNYSITEIILESGFSSISNFYTIFTKIVGCTPLKFKKQYSL